MHDFQYVAPQSLKEALKLLGRRGGGALLAGGTDLIVKMRARRMRPALVVDAKHVPELNVMKLDSSGLTLGAAVSCRRVYGDARVAKAYPALAEAAALVGGIGIQGRASVGGNLCNAAPSADTVPALIVLGAIAQIRGPRGSRKLPVEEFCTGPGRNALKPGELLVSLKIPKTPRNGGAFFLRFIPRNEMDIAVVNAAAAVELDSGGKTFKSARISVGAAAPVPLLVREAGACLAGRPVNDRSIQEAAKLAAAAVKPITDMRGTIEYRRDLAAVLTARALRGAIRRAKGE
ncbi:MAG TPA: FAD binding domain-containing protein [Gammaproteobacteria bacterium]